MKINLHTPQTKYTNLFDIARFKLTWQIGLFASVALAVFNLSLLLTVGTTFVLPSFLATMLAVGSLFLMFATRKYELTAYIFSFCGTVLTNISLFNFPQISHLVDVVWITIILIYAFFALGQIVGLTILLIDFISVSVYINFYLNENIETLTPLNMSSKVALITSTAVCFSILAFILYLFVKTTKSAEHKYLNLTKKLQANNDEKSVLLKEIHHRVKNNLQVIVSLLRLQSEDTENLDKGSIFKDTVDRIRSMSLIHEKIYQTENLANIDLKEYLESLITDLIHSNSINSEISFNIQSDVKTINIKSIVPIALIFNELVSNSIKHAFKNNQTGTIEIKIRSLEDGLKMLYSDDGSWQQPVKENTLGLELIKSLTDQLKGTYKLDIVKGTSYSFFFEYD